MPNKTKDGWKVDIRPEGRNGRRVRKTFSTKAEAIRFENWIAGQVATGEWNDKPKDKRTLLELVELWYNVHGKSLKDKKRLGKLKSICTALGDPLARDLDAKMYTAFRSKRLTEVSANTVNHELAYIRAVFNELIRAGEWNNVNPLTNIRKLRIDETELTYLSIEQIRDLLEALEEKTAIVARICLATGARWGEACDIRAEQIKKGMITFSATKSNKVRTVPFNDSVIKNYMKGKKGRMFVYDTCYNHFRDAIADLEIWLPDGQMTHVLRHSFASHYMMNGGDILALQKILGHSSLAMTIRYAHLAPDHLADTPEKSPLSHL